MQNAVQNLLDSRLALLRNSKIVIQQGGLKENECPLCGHPFDSLTQLNQGIQSKTDALDAYGTHQISSLLLIDDPVQTIDDVNMVGLVDVLRYGFGDRQIFLSTHEQTFDWYIRYKYLKSDKIVEVVNMRELMLQVKKSND